MIDVILGSILTVGGVILAITGLTDWPFPAAETKHGLLVFWAGMFVAHLGGQSFDRYLKKRGR